MKRNGEDEEREKKRRDEILSDNQDSDDKYFSYRLEARFYSTSIRQGDAAVSYSMNTSNSVFECKQQQRIS